MANPDHLAILKQGVEAWNHWREENPLVKPDLREAYLRERDLRGADFSRTDFFLADLSYADLSDVDLGKADLSNVDLYAANLTRANLSGTTLSVVRLRGAILREANLSGAYLHGVELSLADLTGANFLGAKIGWSLLADVDLSTVKGLDSVDPTGPTTIGIDTIYKSRGQIPEIFLRGAGVPNTFITFMHDLVASTNPIQFYSCFISHSSKDKRFCDRLYVDLQAKFVRLWYFPKDATWGSSVWGEIDKSIKENDKLIVVCSKHSLKSGPVLREIERALNREDREGKEILFPIRIDDYLFDTWEHPRKADVLAKVVGDFRGWSRSATKYDQALNRLLAALQA